MAGVRNDSGICIATHTKTGLMYMFAAWNMSGKIYDFKWKLKNGKHTNGLLQRLYNIDNEFTIITSPCPKEELIEWRRELFEKYREKNVFINTIKMNYTMQMSLVEDEYSRMLQIVLAKVDLNVKDKLISFSA